MTGDYKAEASQSLLRRPKDPRDGNQTRVRSKDEITKGKRQSINIQVSSGEIFSDQDVSSNAQHSKKPAIDIPIHRSQRYPR